MTTMASARALRVRVRRAEKYRILDKDQDTPPHLALPQPPLLVFIAPESAARDVPIERVVVADRTTRPILGISARLLDDEILRL